MDLLYDTLNYLINLKLTNKKLKLGKTFASQYLSIEDFHNLEKRLENFVRPVQHLKDYEFFALIRENIGNYCEGKKEDSVHQDVATKAKMINRVCKGSFVQLVKDCIIRNCEI
jgi:hypothetical protein